MVFLFVDLQATEFMNYPDNWKLKEYGHLVPLIHSSNYPCFLSGHDDSGERDSYSRFSHRSMFETIH